MSAERVLQQTGGSHIRVVVADDHAVVRAGMCNLLANEQDIVVVGEAGDGLEALHVAKEREPDVLIVDVEMPGLDGLEVTRRLRTSGTSVRILVLSAYDDHQYVLGILASGAAGYLLKEEALDTLVEAVRRVRRGEYWLSPRLVAGVATKLKSGQQPHGRLTEEERHVLRLVVAGETNREISRMLTIPEADVEKHMEHIFAKLDVVTRVEAAVLAVQEGLV